MIVHFHSLNYGSVTHLRSAADPDQPAGRSAGFAAEVTGFAAEVTGSAAG